MSNRPQAVHTIGHSDLELAAFMDRLDRRRKQLVADLRSSPYSRHVPQFNRENLSKSPEPEGLQLPLPGAAPWAGGRRRTGCTTKRAGPTTG